MGIDNEGIDMFLSKDKQDYWKRAIGIPLEEIPIGVDSKVLVNRWGLKKEYCQVLRVVIMEDHTFPYLEVIDPRKECRGLNPRCISLKDFGRLWANRPDQFEEGW